MGTSSGKELKTVAPYSGGDILIDESDPSTARDRDPDGVDVSRSPERASLNIDKSPSLGHSSSGGGFNFQITEGQTRRNALAGCDNECSPVCDFIFVSGAKVASSYETLMKNKITRVVNCAVTVVDNYFISDPRFTYLSLNLLDSRQDDLTWFVCEVINFIEKGRLAGQKTLIHCEKGVSRSCSFAIAYFMWAQGLGWRESFDAVKRGRPICAPNTGFWCNLIELSELLNGQTKTTTLLLRCANHLAHDATTPVLKLCINQETRKLLMPRTSMLDPRGIFVLRCGTSSQNSRLFIWVGSNSSSNSLVEAIRLADFMIGVVSMAAGVTIVQQYSETDEFKREIMDNGPFNHRSMSSDNIIFDDLYLADPIVMSRAGTPLTKVRSGSVLPDPSTPRQPTPRMDMSATAPPRSTMISPPQSKDVDIFVKARRSSREMAQQGIAGIASTGGTQATSRSSNVSAAAKETDRIIATFNALTAAKGTPPINSQDTNLSTNSYFSVASNDRTSPTFGNKVSGKRNAEEMEIDSPQNLNPMDIDQPSPKHHSSNPPSLELSGENFESFKAHSDLNTLNREIDSCRIDSSSPTGDTSSESKSEFSARLKNLGVSLHLLTSQTQEVPNSLLSIVDKAAEIMQPEKSACVGTGSSGAGKYEIWTSNNPTGSTINSTNTALGGKPSDSLVSKKELHPDHVDSPHVVTYREKPLLYLATPSEDASDWTDYVWLPMGVYDDEDLQDDVMLLLVCPSGTHYIWVGDSFQIPKNALDTPVLKKKGSTGSFDDISDDDMEVCPNMSNGDKEILKWARKVDSTTVVCKKKFELFSPECISVQRQRDECDPFWTAYYDGM